MSTLPRVGTFLVLIVLLNALAGCQSAGSTSSCAAGGTASQVPPVPLHTCPQAEEDEGGMLLKTGALQLGPGVGRDLLRTQGDGEWGL